MPLTMMQKRTDFASFIEALLVVHDANFSGQVDTTERRELEQNVDRKSRIKITLDPERYVVIQDIGQNAILRGSGSFDAANNIDCFIGHRFRVGLFWGKDYTSSQAAFEAAVYNDRDNASPGLLDSIRAARSRTVSGESYMIGLPDQDAFTSILRDIWDFGALGGQPEMCHYLQFETILIG